MSASLGSVKDSLPAPMGAESTTQMQELAELAEESEYGDALRASKSNLSSSQRQSRKRGR